MVHTTPPPKSSKRSASPPAHPPTMNLLDGDAHVGGLAGLASRALLRLLQFAMALAVCGVYGADARARSKPWHYDRGRWLYAVVVGALSAATVLAYAVPLLRSWYLWAWDAVLL